MKKMLAFVIVLLLGVSSVQARWHKGASTYQVGTGFCCDLTADSDTCESSQECDQGFE